MNERVLLGVEINLWSKWQWPPAMEREGVTLTAGIAAAVIQFYPNAESGLFLKGGAGVADMFEAENDFGVIGGLGIMWH